MAMILSERATMLDTVQFATGTHDERSAHMCIMECVAYVTGEPWSDHPQCVSPVIAAFLRSWNDALPEPPRTALLRPLVLLVIGTRTTDADEQTRAWMAWDWLVRVHTPAWLRLAGLTKEAQSLESLARIADAPLARSAQPTIEAARAAAWAAERNAAEDAAGYAAGAAARNAAGDAAWAAAGDAAGDAAWAAARNAAGDAAWAAAGYAAGYAARNAAGAAAWAAAWAAAEDAAWAALSPTVTALQASAVDLVKAMCAVGREEATP